MIVLAHANIFKNICAVSVELRFDLVAYQWIVGFLLWVVLDYKIDKGKSKKWVKHSREKILLIE